MPLKETKGPADSPVWNSTPSAPCILLWETLPDLDCLAAMLLLQSADTEVSFYFSFFSLS